MPAAKKEKQTIIDTHAHIIPRFARDWLPELAQYAREEEVIAINVTPTIDCVEHAIEVNENYPWLLPTAGFHGLFISEYREGDVVEVGELINSKTTAIGAIGLDFDEETSEESKRLQKSLFISQIRLARNHKLSVVVHTRSCIDENIEIMSKFPDMNFVIHGWTGDKEQTERLLKVTKKKVWFGFNGLITRTKKDDSDYQRTLLKMIPQNRILLETGSPSPGTMPQSQIRKKSAMSHPGFIRETAKWIAKSLKMTEEKFIDLANKNAMTVFKMDPRILNHKDIFKSPLDDEKDPNNLK